MPRKVSLLTQHVQPINWSRAFLSGASGALLMMMFVDTASLMGATSFTFENYMGGLILDNNVSQNNWTVGLIANLVLGGIFGIFYGYCFEYVFHRSNARLGVMLGLVHTAIAAVAFFPFFNVMHEQLQTGVYPDFGFFGAGAGPATPIVLLLGHLAFGAAMGTFYGPVRSARVQARLFEPGETCLPGDPRAVTPREDPVDRPAV